MSPEPYILYIEDERSIMELVEQALSLIGHKVIGSNSGRKGMRLMRERKPALVLLDLMMPDFNGWDIFRQMKLDDMLADIPIIVVTAMVPEHDQIIIDKLPPADAYLTKPFDIETLLNLVQTHLKKA